MPDETITISQAKEQIEQQRLRLQQQREQIQRSEVPIRSQSELRRTTPGQQIKYKTAILPQRERELAREKEEALENLEEFEEEVIDPYAAQVSAAATEQAARRDEQIRAIEKQQRRYDEQLADLKEQGITPIFDNQGNIVGYEDAVAQQSYGADYASVIRPDVFDPTKSEVQVQDVSQSFSGLFPQNEVERLVKQPTFRPATEQLPRVDVQRMIKEQPTLFRGTPQMGLAPRVTDKEAAIGERTLRVIGGAAGLALEDFGKVAGRVSDIQIVGPQATYGSIPSIFSGNKFYTSPQTVSDVASDIKRAVKVGAVGAGIATEKVIDTLGIAKEEKEKRRETVSTFVIQRGTQQSNLLTKEQVKLMDLGNTGQIQTGPFELTRGVTIEAGTPTLAGKIPSVVRTTGEIVPYFIPGVGGAVIAADVVVASKAVSDVQQNVNKKLDELYVDYQKTELKENERLLTRTEFDKEVRPQLSKQVRSNALINLAIPLSFASGFGIAKAARTVKLNIPRKELLGRSIKQYQKDTKLLQVGREKYLIPIEEEEARILKEGMRVGLGKGEGTAIKRLSKEEIGIVKDVFGTSVSLKDTKAPKGFFEKLSKTETTISVPRPTIPGAPKLKFIPPRPKFVSSEIQKGFVTPKGEISFSVSFGRGTRGKPINYQAAITKIPKKSKYAQIETFVPGRVSRKNIKKGDQYFVADTTQRPVKLKDTYVAKIGKSKVEPLGEGSFIRRYPAEVRKIKKKPVRLTEEMLLERTPQFPKKKGLQKSFKKGKLADIQVTEDLFVPEAIELRLKTGLRAELPRESLVKGILDITQPYKVTSKRRSVSPGEGLLGKVAPGVKSVERFAAEVEKGVGIKKTLAKRAKDKLSLQIQKQLSTINKLTDEQKLALKVFKGNQEEIFKKSFLDLLKISKQYPKIVSPPTRLVKPVKIKPIQRIDTSTIIKTKTGEGLPLMVGGTGLKTLPSPSYAPVSIEVQTIAPEQVQVQPQKTFVSPGGGITGRQVQPLRLEQPLKLVQQPKEISRLDTAPKEILKQPIKEISRLDTAPRDISKQPQDVVPRDILKQPVALKELQVQRIKTVQRLKAPEPAKPKGKPGKPIPPIPTLLSDAEKKKKLLKKRKEEFITEIRRRGVWRPVIKKGVTKRKALEIGVKRVRQTLGASLRVRAVGTKKLVKIGRETKQFRPGKKGKDPFTLVQRRRARLVSPGERREIIRSRRGGVPFLK